jgi:hypothetical protein
MDAKIDYILAEVHRGWMKSCRLVVGDRPHLTIRRVDREDFWIQAGCQRGVDKCSIRRVAIKICRQGHKAGPITTIPSPAAELSVSTCNILE